MAGLNRGADQQALLTQICAQASSGDFDLLTVNFTGAQLDGEDRLHLHNRKARNDATRARFGRNTLHVVGARLSVVQLRQSTRVEKIVWQLALLSLGGHYVGKRSGDFR